MDLPPLKPDRKASVEDRGDGADSVKTAPRSFHSNYSRGLADLSSANSTWTSTISDGSNARLPNYKDQVRPDGSHSHNQHGDSSNTLIPLASSVHLISGDEEDLESASAQLLLATALQPQSVAVDSKLSVGSYGQQSRSAPLTFTGPSLLPSIPDHIHTTGVDDGDYYSVPTHTSNITGPNTITTKTPSEEPGTRKHLIWAGALVFVVIVVAVATIMGITLAGGDGDPSATSSSSTQIDSAPVVSPTTTTTTSPTVTMAPIPSINSDGSTPTSETPSVPPQSSTVSPVSEQTPTSTGNGTDDLPPPTLTPTKAPVTSASPTRGPVLRTVVPANTGTTQAPVVSPTARAPTTRRPAVAPVQLGTAPVDTSKEVKLVASDGDAGDGFGVSVAISGDVMAVGAYHHDSLSVEDSGAVYIYERSSGNDWTQQAKLIASDAAGTDVFGYSVALSDRTVVVGAYQDDTSGGFDGGSVYVFTRSSSTGVWNQDVHLFASDGAGDHRLGFSVAIDGKTIVAGASGDASYQGSAYVFVNSDSSGWTAQAKLTADGGAAQDFLGTSVGISGDTIVVGALLSDRSSDIVNTGSAHVYVRSGDVWTEQARLLSNNGKTDDEYGTTVAIDGETIVVGAKQVDTDMGSDSGSVFVYSRTEDVWSEQTQLLASGGAAGNNFGASVSISGAAIVVGAVSEDESGGTNSGSAYVYFLSQDDGWTEQARLTASDGAAGDTFGVSVSISASETTTTVVVGAHQVDTKSGADSGAVYVY